MGSRAQTSAECLIRLMEEFRQTDFPQRLPGFHGSTGPREGKKMTAEGGEEPSNDTALVLCVIGVIDATRTFQFSLILLLKFLLIRC